MPDTICVPCNNSLNLFNRFKNICIRSNETLKLRLVDSLKIKKEEIVSSDFNWENRYGTNSLEKVCNPPLKEEGNEWKSNVSGEIDSKQNIYLLEFENPTVKL